MSNNDECTLQEMRAALDSAARLLDRIMTSVGVTRDRVKTVLTAARDVLAKKCRVSSGEAGDAAELRCALKEVGEAFDDDLIATNCEMTDEEIRRMDAVRWHVKCALSRAPRNCDRFVDELDAQLAFLNEEWLIDVNRKTMLVRDQFENWTCYMRSRYARWLMAPAVKKQNQKGE